MLKDRIKILVCGATGFIGRNIVEALSKEPSYDVKGVYFRSKPYENCSIQWTYADLTHSDDVRRVINDIDVIIQAAATTSGAKDIVQRPYLHVTDNAVMNSLIFRQAYEQGVKHVIFFSCSVMYQPSEIPIREDDFDANRQLFPKYFGVGWTKVYIEKMCEFYSRIGDTKYTVIRHSNIYGPHDKYDLEKSHVFGATVTKVMSAKEGDTISIWGRGEEKRDFLYISDLVDFVRTSITLQDKPFGLFNVGSGKAVSVNELVTEIIRHSGKDLKVIHDLSKPTIETSLCLDYSKAKNDFGWTPKVSLQEGIIKTISWYRKNCGK